MPYAYEKNKDQLLNRLRRIEGQVRGIQRMLEEDKYCVDILTQIQAATAGLEKVGVSLLGEHIKGCVADAVATDARDEKIAELVGVVERFMKTKPTV